MVTTQAWRDQATPPADRAASRRDSMTLEEKIALACADWSAVAGLGVPPLVYADGGSGIRGAKGVTALPATIALAATFDRALAEAYGAVLGAELRSAGRSVLLGPAVDIIRTPLGGRGPESFGEDPHLAAAMVAAEIPAIQRAHVIAMVKHVIVNNHEYLRTGSGPIGGRAPAIDVRVGDRALREIYLPPVRSALVDGGALSAMGSYNRLNGEYACHSPQMYALLKADGQWPGFVAPDFAFAVRDHVVAARAGLDIGALDGAGGRVPDDFRSGRIPEDRLDDMVTRILHAMFASGLWDDPVPDEAVGMPSTAEHVAVATRVAIEATVLLRNRDGALPISAQDCGSIAVFGTAGEDAIYTLGGSGAVQLSRDRVTTPLAAISDRAGAAIRVEFLQGSSGDWPLPLMDTDLLVPPSGRGRGMLGEYWRGDPDSTEPVLSRVEPVLAIAAAPDGLASPWSARWTGVLTPAESGLHVFTLTFAGSAQLHVDGALVASGYREAACFTGPEYSLHAVVELSAGRPVELRVEYRTDMALEFEAADFTPVDMWGEPSPYGFSANISLGWQPPDTRLADAAQLAAANDVAVVVVGVVSGEGMDRDSLGLPGDQNALVAAVAAANPRTVVVLNAGGPVLMPWLDDVAAVLQVWYPGQQFGAALAAVLFGDDDPGGRLPVTFPARAEQGPATAPERFPGVDGTVTYDEGILVGYRFFDAENQAPLFPFGHGLSYTTYRYSDLRLARDAASNGFTASLSVTNIGDRAGVEVVQLYVGYPPAAEEPPRQLKGFEKVRLDPGDEATVTFRVRATDLAVFGEGTGWVFHEGKYDVLVGASSRDIHAWASIDLH